MDSRIGTIVCVESTFERKRMRHTVQYELSPHPFQDTSAASRKEERKVARKVAQTTNTPKARAVSNRTRPGRKKRTSDAPINASAQLLRYQLITIGAGTPPLSSATRWTGRALNSSTHH